MPSEIIKKGVENVAQKGFEKGGNEIAYVAKVFEAIGATSKALDVALISILPPWPKMPAAHIQVDPVFNIHMHAPGTPLYGLPPDPPPPSPPICLSHPVMGITTALARMIMNLLFGKPAYTVLINGIPAAQVGDGGVHFRCCGTNTYEVAMGSSAVSIEGDRAARLLDITAHCSMLRMPKPPNVPQGPPMKPIIPAVPVYPGELASPGMITSGSANVLIGGFPLPSFQAMAMKAMFKGVLKGLSKLKDLAKAGKFGKLAQAAVVKSSEFAAKVSAKARNLIDSAKCTLIGEPVDVATGKVINYSVDFTLPGTIPLLFRRFYNSVCDYNGPLGKGWMHNFDTFITIVQNENVTNCLFKNEEGRDIEFSYLEPGDKISKRHDKLRISRISANEYTVQKSRLIHKYRGLKEGDRVFRLVEIRDFNDNCISLEYGDNSYLGRIRDSVGRELIFDYRKDKLNEIRLVVAGPYQSTIRLATYVFEKEKLFAVIDQAGNKAGYNYVDGLLTRVIDRTNFSYFFQYDKNGYCVQTSGEDGIFLRKLSYFPLNNTTVSVDSRGNRTIYEWNSMGLVIRETDSEGNKRLTEWDENANKISETDQDGNVIKFEYDEFSRLVSITDSLGNCRRLGHDQAGNITSYTDEVGNVWLRSYDERGNVLAVTDPFGHAWKYEVDSRGLPVSAIDPLGGRIALEWDEHGNMKRIINRVGYDIRLSHDLMGRPDVIEDNMGNRKELTWDRRNRLVRVKINGDDKYSFTYDGDGYLVKSVNGLLTTKYSYRAGRLLSRQGPSRENVHYTYDKEGDIIDVKKGNGDEWIIVRNAIGRIISEQNFNGIKTAYEYFNSGRLRTVINSKGQRTEFEYDRTGKLVRRKFYDGKIDRFYYDPRGLLVRAENSEAVVQFEYDVVGRVISETVNGNTVTSSYDALGNRLSRKSPYDKLITFQFNGNGKIQIIRDKFRTLMELRYDELGREVTRSYSGNISVRKYSQMNKLIESRLSNGGKILASTVYVYNSNGLLESMKNSNMGEKEYIHEITGKLLGFKTSDGQDYKYSYDVAGNKNGALVGGSTPQNDMFVVHSGPIELRYDQIGNLASKITRSSRFHYSYDSAGRLEKVTNDHNDVIEYGYDPLGRRIRRSSQDKTVEYCWDRDVLLGEEIKVANHYCKKEYLFKKNTFEPLLVFLDNEEIFIESDYIGIPSIAVDDNGLVRWEASFGAFGEPVKIKGPQDIVPFRFQGQYADIETGLYYNRFRYYDPELGIYTTPDPISLRGGLELYNYAPNPTQWIDPYGLSCKADLDGVPLSQNQINDIADSFERRFGQKPEAIHVVGSHAEGVAEATSDIDIFIQTDLPLHKMEGEGFEFFKEINPGKVPPEATQWIPLGGDPPDSIPKAGVIDPFFGPASDLDPTLGPSKKIWP